MNNHVDDVQKINDAQNPTDDAAYGGAMQDDEACKSKNLKKQTKRLLISIFAAIIGLVFLGASFSYVPDTVFAFAATLVVAILTLAIVANYKNWETTYKLSVTVLYIAAVCLVVMFALYESGFMKKIHSSEELVDYINSTGGIAEIIFILINFLQVTIVPIPSSITTTVGALLFDGVWKPLYLTVTGLVIGSMFAFFLGRVFGVRFANWLVGEKTIEKYQKMTKGRDKIVLFYMFVFPFFPDDFLCILAGMTNFTYVGFFFLQIFSRTLGTLSTILVTKGVISIPIHGWWLLLWGALILAVITFLVLTVKYSEKIENFSMKLIDKLSLPFRRFSKQNKDVNLLSAENAGDESVCNNCITSDDNSNNNEMICNAENAGASDKVQVSGGDVLAVNENDAPPQRKQNKISEEEQ